MNSFWEKSLKKHLDLPELQSASFNESLRSDELVAAYSTASFQHDRLQQGELAAAYSPQIAFTEPAYRADELVATYSKHSLQQSELRDADELAAAYSRR